MDSATLKCVAEVLAKGVNNCGASASFTIVNGPLVNEAHIIFNDWATVVVRLVKDMPYVEVEYTVGPIPIYSFEDMSHQYLQVCGVSLLDHGYTIH